MAELGQDRDNYKMKKEQLEAKIAKLEEEVEYYRKEIHIAQEDCRAKIADAQNQIKTMEELFQSKEVS